MERREKKTTKLNREKILQTATTLIKQHGVANISLADISRAAKISKGTLYYYYPTKSALVFDITEQSMNHLSATILHWVEKSRDDAAPRDILRLVIDAVLRTRARGQIHLYLLQEAMMDEALRRRFAQEYGRWRSLLAEGLEKIRPAHPDNAVLSRVLLAVIYGLLIQTMLGADKNHVDEISAFLADERRTPGV